MAMLKLKTDLNSQLQLKEETVTIADGKLEVLSDNKILFSIEVNKLERSFIEEGLGLAKLVIKLKDGNEKEIAYFTKKKVKSFKKLADALNQYIEKKKLVKTTFEEKKPRKGGIGTLYWLYGFAAKHRTMLIIGVILSLITVFLNLIPPYLLKVLIDNVILSSTHSQALFLELTIILIASYASSTVIGAIQSFVLNKAGNQIVTELRSKLFKHAVKLSASDIDNITATRIQTRLTSDAGNTQWLMTYGLSTMVTNILTIVGIGTILFLLFPSLAIYVLIPIPIIILLIFSYNKTSDRAYHKISRKGADIYTKINDVIPNYTIVKSATRENFEGDEFDSNLGSYYKTQMDIAKMELKYWQPVSFLVALATVVIWRVGGSLVIAGTLQLGIVTAFLAYMGMFYGPIQQISSILPYIQESITSGERLREVFDSEDIGKEPNGKKIVDINKDIKLQNVWFGYDPLFPIIKGLNATIQQGKVTAIVGKSGAGKSTIAKILLGLYAIDNGDIKFGANSINDIDVSHLREKIAYVPQDSTFFDNTVAYNMSYFSKGEQEPDRLIAAARAVEMHSEIMRLPLSYDNRIRGRGMSLSGGQRQRLAVARAILGKPDIVLFDEITANLDAINARKVNKSVLNLESDKTMIFVTHDLTEIMNADHVILLENGIIAEQGKPGALIRKKGKLYNIFKYKLSAKAKHSSHKSKKTLESFVDKYIVSESAIKIKQGERRSLVDVVYNNKVVTKLVPKKAFPISNPNMIVFNAKQEKDVFAISDYTKLDSKSKELLEAALEANSFDPVITGIKEIRITGDGLEWNLKTKKGDMKFVTKSRSDIITIGNYVVIIDEFNTPLKIDVGKLDKNSLDILTASI
jgi:ATP-binding cassette, subfamily C, bacterial